MIFDHCFFVISDHQNRVRESHKPGLEINKTVISHTGLGDGIADSVSVSPLVQVSKLTGGI